MLRVAHSCARQWWSVTNAHARRCVAATQSAPVRRMCAGAALPPRDELEYDVAIVGAGPAGLAAAIRLRQLCAASGKDLSVCVLEKGTEVGAHILSGCVLEPRALDELLPDWQRMNDPRPPTLTPVTDDRFYLFTERHAVQSPLTPPQMHNKGKNVMLSLSQLTRWMAAYAEQHMQVDIFPGFACDELLIEDDATDGTAASRRVVGVALKDMGIAKDGSQKMTFQRGAAVKARLTLLAEGARGSLTQAAEAHFGLRDKCSHQTYALGLKEVWRVRPEVHQPGLCMHSVGWPLDSSTYGGSFMYHLADDDDATTPQCRMAVGFVLALDYHNPHTVAHSEFQKWKTHPSMHKYFEDAECLQYGARVLNEGGVQSIPRLDFPGGALIGCAAGFLNVPKIKGTHTAMKSGMLAAETAFESLSSDARGSMAHYPSAVKASWIMEELETVRNIRPGFKYGLWAGLANAAFESYISRGRAPWTLQHAPPDHTVLRDASECESPAYPKPGEGNPAVLDILSSVALSGTYHDHDEQPHLRLRDPSVPQRVNLPKYAGPESKYCPAKVYEYVDDQLVINAQNCLHCKACDVKDPTQNIQWTVPEGGDGPKYTLM
ncbi:Electron transfer flavoprotein-ubiquinone oxidoreductase, mitochondrial [Porphyridium purpureum]|uniref:Electron transfer flavoprotein-ubiquinone oxidoreductase n=1 Tax=Porphyridium purpureum TaxID=35688 RepID=A0A5J4YSN2_PORPP|nr:Electron transfer flavoprotein-ubiquinone oxidoreductase, mitochondrial [Porphyridium purpureum]|eukprot:POR2379..scf236_6